VFTFGEMGLGEGFISEASFPLHTPPARQARTLLLQILNVNFHRVTPYLPIDNLLTCAPHIAPLSLSDGKSAHGSWLSVVFPLTLQRFSVE
jgi:hypothetical protein